MLYNQGMATALRKHQHHAHAGASLVAAARQTLEGAGEQWTAMRADVFATLAAQERPISAYDIAEAVSASKGRRVAANSVYRILDLFVRSNLARRIESANAFVVNNHPGCRHDCMFLICDRCGNIAHVDDDKLSGAVRRAAQDSGFADLRPVIEVRGLCAACAAA